MLDDVLPFRKERDLLGGNDPQVSSVFLAGILGIASDDHQK